MNIYVTLDKNFSDFAAKKLTEKITSLQTDLKRDISIVFASGKTMVKILDSLAKQSDIDWGRIQAFHLDEYRGLSIQNQYSYAQYFKRNLFSKVSIPKENVHFINGLSPNFQKYNQLLKTGADITIVGIGIDGHLGFNEPFSSFKSSMRTVRLNKKTIVSNKSKYPQVNHNPYAITLGMKDIFQSKHIFFFANSISKAKIVKKALTGWVSNGVPASILQQHPQTTVVLDNKAASLLQDSKKVKLFQVEEEKENLIDFFQNPKPYLLYKGSKPPLGVRSHPLFINQKILVLEAKDGESDLFAGNIIGALKENNKLKKLLFKSHPIRFINQYQPNLILIPDQNSQIINWVLKNLKSREFKVLFYETLESELDINLSVAYKKSDMEIVQRSIQTHESQIRRAPYHDIANLSEKYSVGLS
jgi:glucosamine-6-phosphate deaminase